MQWSIDAGRVTRFHDRMLKLADWPTSSEQIGPGPTWQWIETNHRYNSLLWNEEDKARRTDVAAGEIAQCKRLIDQYNQKRNDAVEKLDELLVDEMAQVQPMEGARLNSETAGAMVDRLSILSLKIFHMREQTQRVDAGRDHIAACQAKLARLEMQRADLAGCLDQLLADAAAGRAWFKIYRQFKMYNDPALNPWLYGRGSGAATSPGKLA